MASEQDDLWPGDGQTIADAVALSMDAFDGLLSKLPHIGTEPAWTNAMIDELGRQYSRFKMWAGNIGAHRRGQRSLDFRLRDASHISESVLNILKRLRGMLLDTRESINLPSFFHELDSSTLESERDELDMFESLIPMSIETTLQQVSNFVAQTVKSLLRISMAISNPAPRDRYLTATSIDTSYFEMYDVGHVRSLESFRTSPEFLIQRLGKANTSRRQFLKYSESHRAKMKAGLLVKDVPDTRSTVATPIPSSLIQQHDHDGQRLWQPLSGEHDDAASQTTINTMLGNSEHMKTVPYPRTYYNEEFECPLCFCIVSMKDGKQWKSHQFRDLEPYVCVYEDCITGSRMYGSRHEWSAHLGLHLSSDPTVIDCLDCPMCSETFDAQGWMDHLAQKMQVLALFIVPQDLFDDDEDENSDDSGDDGESQNEHQIVASPPRSVSSSYLISDEGSDHETRPRSPPKAIENTYEDVARYSTKKNMRLVIHDKIYDVSSFVDEHPGGEEVLLDVAGQDASEAFEDVGHSEEAREILDGFIVGDLRRKVGDPHPQVADDFLPKSTSLRDRLRRQIYPKGTSHPTNSGNSRDLGF